MKGRTALLSALLLSGCQMTLDPPQQAEYRDLNGLVAATACDRQLALFADQTARLAPGCANDANLAQMVERREDLLRGRATGPTLAEPVGRAALNYLRGVRTDEQRNRQREQAAQVETGAGR